MIKVNCPEKLYALTLNNIDTNDIILYLVQTTVDGRFDDDDEIYYLSTPSYCNPPVIWAFQVIKEKCSNVNGIFAEYKDAVSHLKMMPNTKIITLKFSEDHYIPE